MWICPNCRGSNSDEFFFCMNCGSPKPLPRKTDPVRPPIALIIFAAVLVLAIIGGVIFFLTRDKDTLPPPEAPAVEAVDDTYYEGDTIIIDESQLEQMPAPSEAPVPTDAPAPDAPAANVAYVTDIFASSELSEFGMTHAASHLTDGDPSTAWVESAPGIGQWEWAAIYFGPENQYMLSGLVIHSGYQKNYGLYEANARPSELYLSFSTGEEMYISLEDSFGPQTIVFDEPIYTNCVYIYIVSSYYGTEFEDTCISEISFF